MVAPTVLAMEPINTPGCGSEPPPDASVLAGLARVQAEVARWPGAPLLNHTDTQARQAVEQALRLRAVVDAAFLHLLADLETRPAAVPGATRGKVAAAFLIHACRVTPSGAAEPQWGGSAPADAVALPQLGQALAEGAIGLAHVDVAL